MLGDQYVLIWEVIKDSNLYCIFDRLLKGQNQLKGGEAYGVECFC